MTYPLQEMFGLNVQFIGVFSPGDTITDAQYYELTCSGRQGQRLRLILVIGEHLLEGDRFLEAGEYSRMFAERDPQYSLLFRVGQECFALCVDQMPQSGCPSSEGF